jgi:sensor histidine kinase regulating citrate/malate metabolism
MAPIEYESHKGVGLYRIRPIIENYHGNIGYKDTGPEGTTFYIRVPILPEGRDQNA